MGRERGQFTNVRGVGSLAAFTLESTEVRDEFIQKLLDVKVLALKSGSDSIRFRMPLVIKSEEIDTALERIASCLPARV